MRCTVENIPFSSGLGFSSREALLKALSKTVVHTKACDVTVTNPSSVTAVTFIFSVRHVRHSHDVNAYINGLYKRLRPEFK
jgi:acid phosphatase family membrane protein YuiD